MSRFLQIELPIYNRSDIFNYLDQLNLTYEIAEEGEVLMLPGNFECAEQPVQIRVLTPLGTISEFGFSFIDQQYRLVCNELDHKILVECIMIPLTQSLAIDLAESNDLRVESKTLANGTRTLILRNQSD